MTHPGELPALTVAQIAGHLRTRPWNVTRELQLGAAQLPGRLRGLRQPAHGRGRGGQWRVERGAYLSWLGVTPDDLGVLDRLELPILLDLDWAARHLNLEPADLSALIRLHDFAHVRFGRLRYLTHNQLDRIGVQLIEDYRPPGR